MIRTTTVGDFPPGTIIMFNDGYCAPSTFCGSILQQVREVLPAVDPNEKYTLEGLCGPEFWGHLTPMERQMAGRIMVRLVLGGWLPFEVVGCRHIHPKKYQLK